MSTLQQSLNRRRAEDAAPEGHLCYSTQPQCSALLVRVASGEQWVLPWMHFVFARHREEGDNERLQLTFVSHEVLIGGGNLGVLAEEAAHGRLEVLRELPPKYRDRQTDEPFIDRIEIRALADGAPSSPTP